MKENELMEYLNLISPKEFENLCVLYLKEKYKEKNVVIYGTRYTKDGGKDIIGHSTDVPFQVWAECKKHARSIGLSEISKTTVIAIAEGINELIYFSLSPVTEQAMLYISNVSAKHNMGIAFYHSKELIKELCMYSILPLDNIEMSLHSKPAIEINYTKSAYRDEINSKDSKILKLKKSNDFYVNLHFKNRTDIAMKNVIIDIKQPSNTSSTIKKIDSNFYIQPGCERVVQIKFTALYNKRIFKIPDICIKYEHESKTEKIISCGQVDPCEVVHFPLIGVRINNFIKCNIEKKLYDKLTDPFILDIRGNCGVGKTRLIDEIVTLAENNSWEILRFDAKKQNNFRIVKEILAKLIGIPYYSGNISVTEETIKKILLLRGEKEDYAYKLYQFLFQSKTDDDCLYYVENALVYFLNHPFLDYSYLISIDNIQELDDSVILFLQNIFFKLNAIKSSIMFIFSTNIELDNSKVLLNFLDGLAENNTENYIKYCIEDLSDEDAKTLYTYLLKDPGNDFLDMLLNKSGKRPYDILMTIKYLQEEDIISWQGQNSWYITDYEKFKLFINNIPKDITDILKKRISYQMKNIKLWEKLKIIITSLLYFNGRVPFDFLYEMGLDDDFLANVVNTFIVRYDMQYPYILFFHDNIYRYFSELNIYGYNKKIAQTIIKWFEKEEYQNNENKYSILFKCYCDVTDYESAYRMGKLAVSECIQNYDYLAAINIEKIILETKEFNLSVNQKFEAIYTLGSCYCEHVDHREAAKIYNNLFDFYMLNKEQIIISNVEACNFFHQLINAHLIANNPTTALKMCIEFENFSNRTTYYDMILYDRYAVIFMFLGQIDLAVNNINKAIQIANAENIRLWKSIVYSDYGYISYHLLDDKAAAICNFENALKYQDYASQTKQRESELLHQEAFVHVLKNEIQQAYVCARKATEICKMLTSVYMEAKALNIWAIACIKNNCIDEAIEHLQNALFLCTSSSNSYTQIKIYTNLGACYFKQHKNNFFTRAKEMFQVAFKILKEESLSPLMYKELFYNTQIIFYHTDRMQEYEEFVQKYVISENLEDTDSIAFLTDCEVPHTGVLQIDDLFFSF